MKQNTLNKMNEMLSYIEDYINNYGYPPSVREIGKALNIKSTATVYYYLNLLEENNYIRKAQSKNRAIEIVKPLRESFPKKKMIDLPLVGNIAAGEPILAIENLEDMFLLPKDLFHSTGDLFMLKVCGESMINVGINDGDIIAVKKQYTADNGDIAVVLIDGNATVKRFYKDKSYYRLHPENDYMDDIIVKDVEILGIVVGLIRRKIC